MECQYCIICILWIFSNMNDNWELGPRSWAHLRLLLFVHSIVTCLAERVTISICEFISFARQYINVVASKFSMADIHLVLHHQQNAYGASVESTFYSVIALNDF